MKPSSSLFPLVIFCLLDAPAPLSLSLSRETKTFRSFDIRFDETAYIIPRCPKSVIGKSIDRLDRRTVGRQAHVPNRYYIGEERGREGCTREKPQSKLRPQKKHWENAKVKPISILSILPDEILFGIISTIFRNEFFRSSRFSLWNFDSDEYEWNRIGRRGRNGRTG